MKKTVIFCQNSNTHGIIDFYIKTSVGSLYLFSQKFRKSAYSHFRKGLTLNEALSFKKAHNDRAIINVIKRLPINISYIEKTYGISVMNKTILSHSA